MMLLPPKAQPGDRVAILSPSLAAPGFAPAVHEQAMARLEALTGLVPVEYPTTRQLGASPEERARDLNAAFADPSIRAILATVGGDDQITVIPHLDGAAALSDPKPFLGYSDNTNLHQWLWSLGIASFHGGSTQIHVGPGPNVDPIHLDSLRAALLTGASWRSPSRESPRTWGTTGSTPAPSPSSASARPPSPGPGRGCPAR